MLLSLSIATVYDWPLGELSNKTHSFGQKAASAHCLYNHRVESEYLVFIDIDEVLVPRSAADWASMVASLSAEHPKAGAFVYQSQMFPRNTKSANGSFINRHHLWSLQYLNTVGVFDLYQWSKVLVNTDRTDIVDIHNVRQCYPGYEIINVKPEVGVVHHYRLYDSLITDTYSYQDRYMSRYKESLVRLYRSMFYH
ncbi:hypothetical protein EB796_003327 [Bugula neritina]|uniref:Glycosyltransferase family 92 protein n=1 Tax=Bugula neritina TaxID=10212 RepID=A0A7J7KI57_BUGNE|nr:hypothetical protein EB796_003327 [Bugula neritina]